MKTNIKWKVNVCLFRRYVRTCVYTNVATPLPITILTSYAVSSYQMIICLKLRIVYTTIKNVRINYHSFFLKSRIKENTIKSPEYYSERSRKLSILHARLRHQCSSLNADLFRINVTNDPKCQCGALFEDSIHYLMEYASYTKTEESVIYFINLRETHKNIETLLFGNYETNINENFMIFNKVRAYIRQTK